MTRGSLEAITALTLTTVAAAEAAQRELAPQVRLQALPDHIELVCGIDVAYDDRLGRGFAAAVTLRSDTWVEVERASAELDVAFPYASGLLSFREAPAVLEALSELKRDPDLIIVDGHGTAHPRGFGLACHVGLATGMPTIGCGKRPMDPGVGMPAPERGSTAEVTLSSEVVGHVVRTQDDVRPVYVSPGHLVDHADSVKWVLAASPNYRISEPIRAADHLVRELRRDAGGN